MLDIPGSTLRYWEKEFKEVSPKKNKSGVRQYTMEDIEQIKRVSFLVKDNGLTIDGARKRLKEKPSKTFDTQQMVNSLENVKKELLSILEELDITPPCGQPF